MQISRHWRLNSQRYRMEGLRVESRYYSNNPELHPSPPIGAILLIGDNEGNVLLTKQPVTGENVGKIYTDIFNEGKSKLHASFQLQKQDELVYGTVTASFLSDVNRVDRPDYQTRYLEYTIARLGYERISPFPVVVNQVVRKNNQVTGVQRCAVTVLLSVITPDHCLYQNMSNKGTWRSTVQILSGWELLFGLSKGLSSGKSHNIYAPSVLVATALYCGLDEKNLTRLNQETIQAGNVLAQKLGVRLDPGVITNDGQLVEGVDWGTKRYLGME